MVLSSGGGKGRDGNGGLSKVKVHFLASHIRFRLRLKIANGQILPLFQTMSNDLLHK